MRTQCLPTRSSEVAAAVRPFLKSQHGVSRRSYFLRNRYLRLLAIVQTRLCRCQRTSLTLIRTSEGL